MQKNHGSNMHKMYLLFHACHEPPTYPLSTRRQSPRTKGHYTELKPTTMAITQKSQPWPKAERLPKYMAKGRPWRSQSFWRFSP